MEISENIFGVLDNCMWISGAKFSLLRWENLSLAVNVLANSTKVSDLTKTAFIQHNLSKNDQTIA